MSLQRPSLMIACLLLSTGILCHRAEAQSNRAEKKVGLSVSYFGDPFPSKFGGNLAYNVTDFVRITGGYGQGMAATSGTSKLEAKTYGFVARFFLPNRSITPVVGLGWAHVNLTLTGMPGKMKVAGLTATGNHLYVTFGLDWQAGNGLNLRLGYSYSLRTGVGKSPCINIGWFFS